MSDRTAIEWAANADGTPGATWNPIRARTPDGKVGWFCVHASDGCRFCYAEAINRRLGTGVDYKAQNADQVEVFLDERTLTQPLRWKKPRTIFVGSMTDLFGEFVTDEIVDRAFAVMALCPQHTFIVLTKRSARMREYFSDRPPRNAAIGRQVNELSATHVLLAHALPLPNVWLGISCEDQANADKRIPDLIATPAAVRFISAEPLLNPIELWGGWINGQPRIAWVIVGGESGQNARPMHVDWARALREQCVAAGVAFFFKQWGEWASRGCTPGYWLTVEGDLFGPCESSDLRVGPGCVGMSRVGKRAAGRALDGRTHDERPPLTQELFS